jgi:hypothetical protein
MNVLGDKRFWYALAALVVAVIAFAIWPHGKTEAPSPAETTPAPATTSPPSPTPESPLK